MFFYLLLLFTVVPLVELALLMYVSSVTNIFFTILLVIFTGILGAALAKRQGLQTWVRIHQETAAGRPPTDALLDGVMILTAGAFLITPGILTDVAGFSLLVPPVRSAIRGVLAAYFANRMRVQVSSFATQFTENASSGESPFQPPSDDDVIDVQFTRKTSTDEPSQPTRSIE